MTYDYAVKTFKTNHPENTRVPSFEHSSERMGGWLLNDDQSRYISFISNYGTSQACMLFNTEEVMPDAKKFRGNGKANA